MTNSSNFLSSISMQETELRKGPWFQEEDDSLANAIALLGERRWDTLAKAAGLRRNGKSCRLRWMNYLRPNLKHGQITEEEESVIIELHEKWGNKWSRIARRLPGKTDNEIKNYWRSYMKRRTHATEKENDTRSECKKSTISTPCTVNGECFSFNSDLEKVTAYSSNALEMLNFTGCDKTSTPCSVIDECFSFKSDIEEFTAYSSDAFEMFSPYNNRWTAPMSNWKADVDKQETEEESRNFHNPEWISYDYSIWDSSLWDKDLA